MIIIYMHHHHLLIFTLQQFSKKKVQKTWKCGTMLQGLEWEGGVSRDKVGIENYALKKSLTSLSATIELQHIE